VVYIGIGRAEITRATPATSATPAIGESVEALKESMMEGMHALSMRNVLNVIGLSHFGVFVLYAVFGVMLLLSLLFLIWGVRAESSRRFLYFNTLFMTIMSMMAYLAMATGNGILVLRKMPHTNDFQGSWRISDPLLAHKVLPCFASRAFPLSLLPPLSLSPLLSSLHLCTLSSASPLSLSPVLSF